MRSDRNCAEDEPMKKFELVIVGGGLMAARAVESGVLSEPSNGLEPLTPSLPWSPSSVDQAPRR
jgi:hypothetical protein